MEKFIEIVVYSMGGSAMLIILLLIAPMFGGFGGWIFAYVFEDSFAALMGLLNWDASGFEAGAALAFIGSFLKAGARLDRD